MPVSVEHPTQVDDLFTIFEHNTEVPNNIAFRRHKVGDNN